MVQGLRLGFLQIACVALALGGCSSSSTPSAADPLVAEAGFLDVPPQPGGADYPARLFYVFQPADEDAAHKPLVIFSNGGPGDATTRMLLAYGTGRETLDPNANATAPPAANPSSWTGFANLLYFDARETGFSYNLGGPDAAAAACSFVPEQDAADFVYALLAFFDAHEALRTAPVVLAFESYGGTRAAWMLDILLRYATEASKVGPGLEEKIQAHLDKVFPQMAGKVVDVATIATQFRAQVLIEPVILGERQDQQNQELDTSMPALAAAVGTNATADAYDVREPAGWSDGMYARAEANLAKTASSTALLGVDLASISLLKPAARADAFHPSVGLDTTVDQALAARFGALRPNDAYYAGQAPVCASLQTEYSENAPFFANLRSVKTFITDGQYDAIVVSRGIANVIQAEGYGGTVDTAPRSGVDRPGWIEVNLPAADGQPAQSVEIRFPPYEAGHFVALSQPAALRDDVEAWLREP